MSTPARDDTAELPAEIRAAGLELAGGSLVVYDPKNHRAWVESDRPVELDAVC